ncbi:hypothetical protein Bealeia1_02021 (plasmid) [Candidatus Bealeia paramacronuclearis]|uniref:Transposase n=1 Tax=Candidatus Bealeia paramacronuclearis TaxID=1921001 RepID=A0ABZ2C9L5_9PROT
MVFDNDVISAQLAFENVLIDCFSRFMATIAIWRMITIADISAPRLMRKQIPKRDDSEFLRLLVDFEFIRGL